MDHRGKIKKKQKNKNKNEKWDKYLDLARKLKMLWNIKVTVIPIIIDALGTFPKGLVKGLEDSEIEGRAKTTQNTDRPKYWEESGTPEETCCQSV